MCVYACVYVCMYVCMHACMYVCIYVYVSVETQTVHMGLVNPGCDARVRLIVHAAVLAINQGIEKRVPAEDLMKLLRNLAAGPSPNCVVDPSMPIWLFVRGSGAVCLCMFG